MNIKHSETVILLVEDEPDQRALLTIRLEANGYKIITADTGAEVLSIAKEKKPSLILLDFFIPEINGLKVCESLKGDGETKDIPVIMQTAAGESDIEQQCITKGATACLRKPFSAEKLLLTIKQALSAAWARDRRSQAPFLLESEGVPGV